MVTVVESHASSAPHQVLTSTITAGSIVSTSISQAQQIFNGSFTVLSTTGTKMPCEFWAFNFTATVGQFLSGGFSSDNAVSFFVVQQATYQKWVAAGICGNAGDAITSQSFNTGYNFTRVAIPTSGTWSVVIVNSSNAKNADGSLTLSLSAGAYSTTQRLTSAMTTTITSTSATASGSGQSTGIGGFPFVSIVVGIMVGLAAVAILRRRHSS
jgi:hypothetical protein